MKHGSLFSGIGGFDLAAEWLGWENIFHCEWNEFGQKILKYYWPNAISYGDITKTVFTIHRGNIDILTGGFPCQPYSAAGKRKGKEDERHLWPEMLRAVREISPTWVVGENVSGLVNWNGGMVFDEVQADLEAEGYEILPFLLPACGKNAPHKRERVWFVAYSESNDNRKQDRKVNTDRKIKQGRKTKVWNEFEGYGTNWDAANTFNERLQRNEQYSKYEGKNKQRETWTHGTTSEFHRGDNWQNWPTQSPICGGNDGLSNQLDGITFPKWRNESIKAYGNAIVPQVVYEIFKAIEKTKSYAE